MYRLDKTVFTKQSFKESDNQKKYWLSKSPAERFSAAVYLQSIIFNFDPENPPRMDKSIFSMGKQQDLDDIEHLQG